MQKVDKRMQAVDHRSIAAECQHTRKCGQHGNKPRHALGLHAVAAAVLRTLPSTPHLPQV